MRYELRLQPKLGVVLGALLLVGACTDRDTARGPVQPPDTAVARFAPGGEVSVIEVDVSDRRPLRSATLVGPGGVVVPAFSMNATRPVLYEQPVSAPAGSIGIGLGGFGGGEGGGFGGGLGLSAPLSGLGGPSRQPVLSTQLQSTALLRLPDPPGYRQNWRLWQVRLQIGDPPDVALLTLAAPQPPDNL